MVPLPGGVIWLRSGIGLMVVLGPKKASLRVAFLQLECPIVPQVVPEGIVIVMNDRAGRVHFAEPLVVIGKAEKCLPDQLNVDCRHEIFTLSCRAFQLLLL